MLNSENWTLVLAAWGALTGTVGSTVAFIAYYRDRSRIRFRLTEISEAQARTLHDRVVHTGKQRYFLAEAVNAGRRVRYVYRPDVWTSSNNHLLTPEAPTLVFQEGEWRLCGDPWEAWRLDEGQSITFVFSFSATDRVVRAYIPDTLARKVYFRPRLGRLRWWYAKRKGGDLWKYMRELTLARRQTRHHDTD